MKITIRDIARMTNLSTATVSRVLNNKPDVSPHARKLVQDMIDTHNYNPSSVARSLSLNKTNTIGLILPDITNPFFPELARGIGNRAKDFGYSVIHYDLNNDNSELAKAINMLRTKQVDGIIIVQWASLFLKELDAVLRDEEIPIVAIDREDSNNYVNFDNIVSSFMAVSYLLENGHRKIAHITGDMDTIAGQKRKAGYVKALQENRIALDNSLVIQGKFTIESGKNSMRELLKSNIKPTAVFAANDMIAIGVYEAIHEAGLHIPEDISVIGHDDIEFSSLIKPELTTVVVPRYQLGISCVEVLNCMMKKRSKELFPHNLAPSMAIRSSVRKLV
jgi:LacI family transcriptional regulator, galactose operon repressor